MKTAAKRPLTLPEWQLIQIIRAARNQDNFAIAIEIREHRYSVRVTAHDPGAPGTGVGYGKSFDAAWRNMDAVVIPTILPTVPSP